MRPLPSACLAALLLATSPPAAAQEMSGDLTWGVNGHPFTSYPGVTIEQQLDYVKELGMTSYRVDVTSAGAAPALARLVRAGKERGIAILPVVAPKLDLDKETAGDLYTKARQLAVALVAPLKDDIRVWELGNEMENYAIIRACEMQDNGVQYNCAWGPAGGVTALEYYGPRWAKVSAVLKGLSDGTIAVDPTIRKAIGTAGWGHTGVFARMQQDGIKWDISVWHMYGQDPEWAFKTLAAFNRPIWVTEFNNPGGSHGSAREQADGLVRAMTRLRQLQRAYKVEAAHVYELMDETYWAPNYEAFMGLVGLVKGGSRGWTPGAPKPAFAAVKQVIALSDAAAQVAPDCHVNPHNRLSAPASMLVSYAHCLVLGRAVDEAGSKTWTTALQKGTTVTQMLQAMVDSAEFRSRHARSGVSNSDFVSLLYRRLLDRAPDDVGRAAYAASLEAGTSTRPGLVAVIVGSAEFRAKHPLLFTAVPAEEKGAVAAAPSPEQPATGRRCNLEGYDAKDARPQNAVAYGFCLVLGRTADGSGLERWSKSLSEGWTGSEMLVAMLSSAEFRSTHNADNLSSAEFVGLMFRVLLDREPDGSGLSAYAGQLETGALKRPALQKAIIASSEFASKHPILAGRKGE